MGQSLGKPGQTEAVKSAVAQLLGPSRIQPELLRALLETGIATAQTSQELEQIDMECSKLATLMTEHLARGNYTALAEFIADSVDDLLKDFDPIAPSRYALSLLRKTKHAIFYLSTWTRHAMDDGCEDVVVSALGEYEEENHLEDCDIAADVFENTSSGRSTATPHVPLASNGPAAAATDQLPAFRPALRYQSEDLAASVPATSHVRAAPAPMVSVAGQGGESVAGPGQGPGPAVQLASATTAGPPLSVHQLEVQAATQTVHSTLPSALAPAARPGPAPPAAAPAGASSGPARRHPPLVFHVVAGLMRLVQVAVVPCTRDIVLESVRALLVLLSLDVRAPARTNPFLAAAMLDRRRLSLFTVALLSLVSSSLPAPALAAPDTSLVGGMLGVLSSPWSLFQAAISPPRPPPTPTATLTLALDATALLLAAFYAQPKLHRNFIRPYLAKISDRTEAQTDLCVSYDALFQSLCAPIMCSDLQLLLSYTLFYNNSEFLAYVFSRVGDVDQLLLPLLARLFDADTCPDFVLHTSIASLLILSQETQYVDAWFDCTPAPAALAWYTDRILKGACLGDVVTLVLLRTYQYNLKSAHDAFVSHTCLAALCNMAPRMVRLHAYTSQRLVAVLTLLARQHTKLAAKYVRPPPSHAVHRRDTGGVGAVPGGAAAVGMGGSVVSAVSSSTSVASAAVAGTAGGGAVGMMNAATSMSGFGADAHGPAAPTAAELQAGLAMVHQVESGIAHVLQVVATVLSSRLRHNANLVYSLLVEQDAVLALQTLPRCASAVATIRTLVTLVRTKFEGVGPGASADHVLAAVAQAVRQLPDDRLPRPRVVRYEYEESPDASDYFLPCVWAAVAVATRMLRPDLADSLLA